MKYLCLFLFLLSFRLSGQVNDSLQHVKVIFDKNGKLERKLYYSRKSAADSVFNIYKEDHFNRNGRIYKTSYYENSVEVRTRSRAGRSPFRQSQLDNTMNLKGPWMISAGYVYQNEHLLQVGIKKLSHVKDDSADDIMQPVNYLTIGAELAYNKKLMVAPKIGVGHYDYGFLNFNLNAILYNDAFKTFSPALTPEIGFSFPLGIVQINYGYNIYIRNEPFTKGKNHRIALYVNIPLLSTGK